MVPVTLQALPNSDLNRRIDKLSTSHYGHFNAGGRDLGSLNRPQGQYIDDAQEKTLPDTESYLPSSPHLSGFTEHDRLLGSNAVYHYRNYLRFEESYCLAQSPAILMKMAVF